MGLGLLCIVFDVLVCDFVVDLDLLCLDLGMSGLIGLSFGSLVSLYW